MRYVDEDDISFVVLEVQVWGCTFMFPSCDVSYRSIEDFDHIPSASSKILEFDGRLDRMWLFPNTRKWYLDSQFPS